MLLQMALIHSFLWLNNIPLWGSPGSSVVKNPPPKKEMWVRFLGLESPLEKEMPTHSTIPAWEIPWTEEPGRL